MIRPEGYEMTEFRLTQISDTHLARRLPKLTANFDRIRDHIDATRPDLVVNSGDLAFDALQILRHALARDLRALGVIKLRPQSAQRSFRRVDARVSAVSAEWLRRTTGSDRPMTMASVAPTAGHNVRM